MFASDNYAGVSPEILKALEEANRSLAPSYGEDDLTKRVTELFCEIFERPVYIFFTSTGTAANALALAQLTPSYGAILAHHYSHINTEECGAVEHFTGGAKIIPCSGTHGKITPDTLADPLKHALKKGVHASKPTTISLTQPTELGTIYTLDEIKKICHFAHQHKMYVHMDGARFANALVPLECSPADMSWRAGVDVLSFGATKNGAMLAEAVIFFDERIAKDFKQRLKQSGQLLSKMRFVSAQFQAYFKEDLWLSNAYHANEMAKYLASQLQLHTPIQVLEPVETNEVFVRVPPELAEKASKEGFTFQKWYIGAGENVYRLVTHFSTEKESLDKFIDALNK